MQWGKDWRQSSPNSWRYCRLMLRHPLLFWSCSGTWWRRSEWRSAAWKLPCSDSETTNYPPLPGNRLKISRELIINTKYPNLHLCISWWRVNIMVNILVLVCSSILPSPEAVQSWIIILELESRSRSLTEQNSKFVIYHKFWYSRDGAIDTSLVQTLQWISRPTARI